MDFLKQECIRDDAPPVVLVGHSIGAYMALHATRMLEAPLSASKLAAGELKAPQTPMARAGSAAGAPPDCTGRRLVCSCH